MWDVKMADPAIAADKIWAAPTASESTHPVLRCDVWIAFADMAVCPTDPAASLSALIASSAMTDVVTAAGVVDNFADVTAKF